jgi:septal ring factor EnvC (AmiA/AmiB activator)
LNSEFGLLLLDARADAREQDEQSRRQRQRRYRRRQREAPGTTSLSELPRRMLLPSTSTLLQRIFSRCRPSRATLCTSSVRR